MAHSQVTLEPRVNRRGSPMIHARVAVVGIGLYICEVVCSACRVKPAVECVKDLTHQG
ncbi:hypothetical protein BLIG_00337 [Bifidobacterium longum subsp. infantis CCUG 52486]|uniref:Uncharacterized protein n=1 Tax=Bifidobacterium longum subsp. infantis CCUG 52486 TaxID=537937 RepID=C5E8F3_BIFLI|nr:hypothetical protein BLIG_00337 [Bifidobacterium longum subsp. infantis CCUG 52486]